MEKSGTTVPHQNPTFAILGLSHIPGRCAGVPEWSPALSVSCFGGSKSTSLDSTDHDDRTEESPQRPTRYMSGDAIIRKLSAKANQRRLSTMADRAQSRQPPPPATQSPSLQVPSVGCGREKRRSSRGHSKRNSALSSESLIIRPLRGNATGCSSSADWPTTRQISGSSSRTKISSGEAPPRRDAPVLPPTTVSDNEDWRGASTTTGRHLDVFLPSLPIAVKMLGLLNDSAVDFLRELGRRICSNTNDERQIAYLFQRLSVTVQRFNAVILHDSFSTGSDLWPSMD